MFILSLEALICSFDFPLYRYFVDHPPTKLLSPEYMSPPNWPDLVNMKHKIIALDKNHAQVRSMD